MKIALYDTTLRDGVQGCDIEFSALDRNRVISLLDGLGIDYIEAVNFDETPLVSGAFPFEACRTGHAVLTAFGSTCRPYEAPEENRALALAAASDFSVLTIVGKSSLFQVQEILRTERDENLRMIRDTVSYLTAYNKTVFFDAEHFFDGYLNDPDYALLVLKTAIDAGAGSVMLCDTNGGMLPDSIREITKEITDRWPSVPIGIHCHNDIGMADSATLSAVYAGASIVQGCISGIGERCGNTNLNTIIPILQLKLGYECVSPEQLKKLTYTARLLAELANRSFDENEPFVGSHAFAHKAGMHIDGVVKQPRSFEHIDPTMVGNERSYVASRMSGRAAIVSFLQQAAPELGELDKSSPLVEKALSLLKEKENEGYHYEGASASLHILLRGLLGLRKRYFELMDYQVNINESETGSRLCTAIVKIRVNGETALEAGEGFGPVNALDIALRKTLSKFYPSAEYVRLTDYRVRVLETSAATASTVRVVIETTDGTRTWRTTGASYDIIAASWQALADSYEYAFLKENIIIPETTANKKEII